MTIERIQQICLELKATTEDIKWENDLCFCVGNKMFLTIGLEKDPTPASFKVPEKDFNDLVEREGFKPAPYLARYHWVYVDDIRRIVDGEWHHYARQSHRLVAEKLPKKIRQALGLHEK